MTVEEMKQAEVCLLRYEQGRYFSKLLGALGDGTKLITEICPWSIRKLDPFVCNSILRVGVRITKVALNYKTRHPAILTSESWFTWLVITCCHELVGHSGMSHTFADLREK